MNNIPVDGYMKVGPTLARNWLEEYNYEHQRPLRKYHIETLAKEMTEGRFRNKTQITFCLCDNTFHLTNGQHTLSAIAKSGCEILLSVVVNPCLTMKEVADDFSRHDTHLTRRLADALSAHEIDKELGVTKTELQWIAAASSYYGILCGKLSCKNITAMSHDEKMLQIECFGEYALGAIRTFHKPHGKGREFLTRKTTLACAMHVYMWDQDACASFYGEISRDDGLKTGDPRKTLLTFFNETKTPGGTFGTRNVKRAEPDHILVKAQAVAFNAYIKRKELKIIRVDRDARDVVFDGPGPLNV